MKVGDKTEDTYTNDQIMWYDHPAHDVRVVALLLGVLDRISFAKHREQ
jgi:hypothetical protein